MKKALVEFEIDLEKMPLGKLSQHQLKMAWQVLNDILLFIKVTQLFFFDIFSVTKSG
jgi:hypothetical protein